MPMPEKEIKKLRKAVTSERINPAQQFSIDCGNGEIHTFTGEQILKTANAFLALADADKSGDKVAMKKALERIANNA